MDKIDRYILRGFIQTLLFGIIAFIFIFIVVHLIEHIDDFSDHNVPASAAITYYLYMTPNIIHLVLPIAMLLASLFSIGRLDTTNELTAIRSSGRSMRRVALPLLLFGLVMSSFMVYFDGWLLPHANKKFYNINRKYLGTDIIGGQRNVYIRLSPSVNLLMDYFDPVRGEANLVSIERFDTAAPLVIAKMKRTSAADFTTEGDTIISLKITERIDAGLMRYDSTRKLWMLINGTARNFADEGLVTTTSFETRDAAFIPITPAELNLSQHKPDELTVEEFRDRIEQERRSGRDVGRLLVDYYAKFSFPFSAMIVIFFGIPFSSAQRKGGAAIQIAVTALVSAIYLILTELSKAFSYGSMLHPMLVAWMVNIIFVVVGLINLYRIERG